MKRFAYAVPVIAALVPLALGANAAPLVGESLQQRISGSVLRMEIGGTYEALEDHLWRFHPDGSVTGHLFYVRTIQGGSYHVEKSDTGHWRAEGDRVCVSWSRFFWAQGSDVCFQVATTSATNVTLVTDQGRHWRGRLDPDGHR